MKLRTNVYIIFIIIAFQINAIGQNTSYSISGQVLEISSNAPIEYATVIIQNAASGDVLKGETTDADGRFQIATSETNVAVEISFIGYENLTIEKVEFINNKADLGVIYLKDNSKMLDEVVVRGEKSQTEFKLDKRVFNVGTDLSSTGASALEVLNNVPSVNVNIEGEVALRGSTGVQILINGKPSILTNEQGNALGTITADMIEKVEVITNPSAKYEAEGTSGIINIILKKEEKKGLNGSVTLNTGTPHNHSLGLSLNRRTEKLNLFTQAGVGYRELPNDNRNENRNKDTGVEIRSIGEEFRNEVFYNFILGADYYINKNNVITLSGSAALEIEKQPSETNFEHLNDQGAIESTWTRTEETEATNPKYQYELQYKRDFEDDKDHQLLFSAIGNFFGKDQSSEFFNAISTGDIGLNNQLTATNFQEGKYTFNLDYTKPFGKQWTLESGAQYLANDVSNDYEVVDLIDGEEVLNEGLTNVFEYDQKVLGVYTTGAYEGNIWGLKVGLRVENTDLQTLLVNTNEDNSTKFTNYFPSAHTSYKLSDAISFQAGYSRRIRRPRLWDLNPFFNIRNNFSIRTGNPALLPEFTDSYEVGSIFIFDKTSFNLSVYHRYTTDIVERVATFQDNITTVIPLNIGTRKSTGIELNFKYSLHKKITLNGDANYNIFSREGMLNDQDFSFDANQYSGKLTTKYKVNKKLEMEVTSRYESKRQTIQGEVSDNLFADFGMRYKILNGRGVFNFSVRDVFASRIRESFTDQTNFYSYSRRLRGRFITIGFSFGFGKGEAMQFSSGRRR